MPNVRNYTANYQCPVCGYDEMDDPPNSGNICSCCGTQFDSDDFDYSHSELRSSWISQNMPWFSRGKKFPKNWNPFKQLINAGHGGDLMIHRRFEADVAYRYSVADAFSDVRMARQLKAQREGQDLTQAQVADRTKMKQSRISELENTDYSAWTISNLRRFARAHGVWLFFGFASWAQLQTAMVQGISAEALFVPSFEQQQTNVADHLAEVDIARRQFLQERQLGILQNELRREPLQLSPQEPSRDLASLPEVLKPGQQPTYRRFDASKVHALGQGSLTR